MKTYEASAKTVEEAIELGLQELGVSIGDVDVQVLEEGSKGLFGLFGSRLAKVRLTVREEEENLLEDLISEEAKTGSSVQKPAKAKKPVAEKKAEEKSPKGSDETSAEQLQEMAAPVQEKQQEKPPRPAPVKRVAPKKAPKEAPAPEKETDAVNTADQPDEKPSALPMEKPVVTVIPEDQLDPESPAGLAYAFLKEVTRLMGVDVSIEMGTDPEGNVYGSMTGDTLGILIGRRGETLDALQYLTSLKVNRGRDGYIRVTLDTENYRARREDTLIRLANRMANRAVRTGRRVSLEPMNPYERRIIHYALQQNESVSTHSEGDEPNRHVVITVKK